MTIRIPAFFALALAVLLPACGDSSPPAEDSSGSPAPASSEAAPANGAAGTPSAGVGFGPPRPRPSTDTGEFGVAECDQLTRRYEACMDKAPAEARGSMQTALETWRGTWKTLAANPLMRETLASNCRTAAANVAEQMRDYGCDP